MNNKFDTIYLGKTCENVRKYRNIRIEQDPEKALKKISKFTFVNCQQIGNLLVFDMKKEEVTLDKPRYIGILNLRISFKYIYKLFIQGATVLNLAKVIMYDYHYNFIMKKFPTARLLFTDTDSLCYHIETEKDLYDEIKVRLLI